MKTDVIRVSSSGRHMQAALAQAEKVAAYKELSPRNALHLRLLTEEAMGMMRSITGETTGDFWIEDEGDVYQLHLTVTTRMTPEKRETLLEASTSGKNEAARGLMGRLRDFFEYGASYADPTVGPTLLPDMYDDASTPVLEREWSMMAYQAHLVTMIEKNDEQAKALWDELEKSVVTHVADEVKVSIRGQKAELIIFKKMN